MNNQKYFTSLNVLNDFINEYINIKQYVNWYRLPDKRIETPTFNKPCIIHGLIIRDFNKQPRTIYE